jgi:hypothetical protein
MIFATPLTSKDMPFFSKWADYYNNHKTETLDALFLDSSDIKTDDIIKKHKEWYKWYKQPKEYKNDVYVWYIMYEWNVKTDKVHKIGAVNFAGCLEECETIFFLIPKFRNKGLASDMYWKAEWLLLDKYKVKYIWGEACSPASSKVFQECWFDKLPLIEEYYKYI